MKRSCQTTQAAMLDCLAPTQLAVVHRQHIEHCIDCEALWTSHAQALAMGTRLQTQRDESPLLTDRIYQQLQVRAERREPGGWGASLWSSPWGWALGAAVFALAVWVQLSFAPSQPSQTPAQATARRAIPAPLSKPQRSPVQERKTLMPWVFASMDMTFAQDRALLLSTSPIEKAAVLWDQELEDDARYSIALAMRSSAFELRDVDPSPISQALPPSLSALRPLLGMVRREL